MKKTIVLISTALAGLAVWLVVGALAGVKEPWGSGSCRKDVSKPPDGARSDSMAARDLQIVRGKCNGCIHKEILSYV